MYIPRTTRGSQKHLLFTSTCINTLYQFHIGGNLLHCISVVNFLHAVSTVTPIDVTVPILRTTMSSYSVNALYTSNSKSSWKVRGLCNSSCVHYTVHPLSCVLHRDCLSVSCVRAHLAVRGRWYFLSQLCNAMNHVRVTILAKEESRVFSDNGYTAHENLLFHNCNHNNAIKCAECSSDEETMKLLYRVIPSPSLYQRWVCLLTVC